MSTDEHETMSTMWDPAIEHLYQKFKSRLQAELLVEIPFSPLDGDYGRLVELYADQIDRSATKFEYKALGCEFGMGFSERQIETGDGSTEEIGGP